MQDHETAAIELEDECEALGLSVSAEFVPLSKSRNAKEKSPTLNWTVSVYVNRGRVSSGSGAERAVDVLVWRGDYSQGIARLPGYGKEPHGYWNTLQGSERIKVACEAGKHGRAGSLGIYTNTIPAPSIVDIVSSLCMDSSAIDSATFEEWADEMGFDRDSRKGEAIYRACLETALKLRSALGDAAFSRLRDISGRL